MPTRDLWLEEGAVVLAEEGPDGVRVDRLAARLAVTKGSFHHHFNGIVGYHGALLAVIERRQVELMEAVAVEIVDRDPLDALRALPARLDELSDADLDRALRAWAVGDSRARAAVERIDAARLDLLEGLWSRAVADPARAHAAAMIPHLLLIGANSTRPPLDPASRRALFELLPGLLPHI